MNFEPGDADHALAALIGEVAADRDQLADVRLVRAVAGGRPVAHRAEVAAGQVVAGQLRPGHREAEHPGRAPALDGVQHRQPAVPELPALRAAGTGSW